MEDNIEEQNDYIEENDTQFVEESQNVEQQKLRELASPLLHDGGR